MVGISENEAGDKEIAVGGNTARREIVHYVPRPEKVNFPARHQFARPRRSRGSARCRDENCFLA